jgi:hypothetical protein
MEKEKVGRDREGEEMITLVLVIPSGHKRFLNIQQCCTHNEPLLHHHTYNIINKKYNKK